MKFPFALPAIAFGCLCLAPLLLSGCDRAETPPPEPAVVRKKIAPPPEHLVRESDAEETAEDSRPTSEAPVLARADVPPEPMETEIEPEPAVPDSEAPGTEPVVIAADLESDERRDPAAPPLAIPSETEPEGDVEDDRIVPEIVRTDAGIAGPLAAYDPGDRVDPFEPLFRDEPEAPAVAEAEADEPARPARRLTPLERVDLSQLKLVGIIRAPSGDRALVEEASGKGYIITRGTYIGIHSGQVVEIRENGIVVEEKHRDVFGEVDVRRLELKFQRPAGDGIL